MSIKIVTNNTENMGRVLKTKTKRFGSSTLFIPSLLFLIAFFAYPVFRLLLMSFYENGQLTIAHFQQAFSTSIYLVVLWETLVMALSVTFFSLLLGYPIAYFLTIVPPKVSRICFIFVLLPFWTSLLVRTYAWMVLLGRNGVINNSLLTLGITDEPVKLLFNWFAVNIGMIHVLLPFIIFPIYNIMKRIDTNLVKAAEGLGASKFRSFVYVFFPLSLPGVLTGSLLVFIMSIGYYITPALLGGGQVIMIAVLIEEQVNQFLNWGFAAALAAVLLTVTVIIVTIYNRFMGWDKTWT